MMAPLGAEPQLRAWRKPSGRTRRRSADPQIRATFSSTGPDSIGLREHAGTLTLWQRDGRILVTTANELQASLRTTA